ncbi:respiratory nitrate reductase subunit gamma [Pseudalkalibacillus caeni]|uniref:Respiratory nitrate reductase subunit gamma n=1 Tax=Exobacillus caeni TaxID=2574798 RepID=A0A5R9F2K8_9BACL|nr:respiratory nitrate reductase subunit gamma [Pseudalkalibacillus caeni]TLS37837.1 respiratory nitrate reductase subunit gamma [Pseudalkalibacillus caeni]
MKQLERSFYSKTSMYSFFVIVLLFFSMWIGTSQFKHIDMALIGYMISSFIFAIGLTVRMCSWLIRPATHQVIKRSFKNLKTKERKKRNIKSIATTAFENIVLQKFIFKRGLYRGIQHFLIAWGCIGSFAITFGLTFGWMHFDLIDPDTYQIIVMGIPTIIMPAHGIFAEMVYNGLNITALMVLVGVIMAITRRIRSKDVKVTQRVEFDLFPLYLLLAVTGTGLLLTVLYTFLEGWMHPYMSLVHQVTVVVLLIYFPFGKLFHLPIRPLATAVPLNYQETVKVDTRACLKCNTPYSSDDQIEDVKGILGAQAFDLKLADGSYLSDYCPACRRRIRVMKQLNMEAPLGNPYDPVQTRNGIHISGFGKKRQDEFYNKATKSDSKQEERV